MRHRSRAGRVLVGRVQAGRVLAAVGAAALVGGASGSDSRLDIEVHSLRSSEGLVHLCMTARPDHFPDCADDAAAYTATVPAAATVKLRLTNLKPGRYAIALLHDENGNGKVDKTLMLPREGFGFSRDAKIRMGPPSFEHAAFDLGEERERQRIRMRYLL